MNDALSQLNWPRVDLESQCLIDREILNESTPSNLSFYYIDISAVTSGRISIPSNKIAFRGAPSRARKVVRDGDVLMATVRPNLKAFAYAYLPNDNFVASTGFTVLTAKECSDAKFLLYSILSDDVTKQIDELVVGSNYPAINIRNVRRLRINAPGPREQRKIAAILTTVDNLIERTEALIAKYQALKQGLMHDLFTRGVDARGQLRPSQADAPELYKETALGWIPKEWLVLPAMKICSEITKGTTPQTMYDEYEASTVPFIRVQNLSFDGTLLFDEQPSFVSNFTHNTFLARSKGVPGDVLMNIVGPPMGKVSVIPKAYPEWNINQAIALFRTMNPNDSGFLMHFLLSDSAFRWLISRAKRTSGQTNLTLELCRELPVPRPNEDERIRIANLLNKASDRIACEQLTLNKLRSLKSGLMQDLLTGKVRVKVDEDAGASVHA